ncbi:MAG TPA: hypothetical protein VHJ39_08800 [Solirubrobacteraceae bacterium]|jgi:hypothetical protein|nr:hypothetical protein [Solirubrobacteraceae bacterium]
MRRGSTATAIPPTGASGETLTLALLAGAVVLTVLVRLLARIWPGVDVPALARLVPYMPFAIRIHLAVSMVGLLSLGYYLSPAMDLEADVAGILLGANMAVVAITMATGWKARWGAALLVAAGPIGMLEFGVWPVLQRIDLLGLAIYVLIAGPGRWAADHESGAAAEPALLDHARAIWALKVAAGLALIIVAFAEKLATPDLAVQFLADHPELNVVQQLGIDMSDLEFARFAGAVEVLFGLLLISGALPQAIILIAGIPFNATLWFFGTNELMGHLPIYGAMLAVLVYGSDARLRPAVAAMLPAGLGETLSARRRDPRPEARRAGPA